MKKRNRGHINDTWISTDAASKTEVCALRHEIGRAGYACCNCAYNTKCTHREDKVGSIASTIIRTDKEE